MVRPGPGVGPVPPKLAKKFVDDPNGVESKKEGAQVEGSRLRGGGSGGGCKISNNGQKGRDG